MAHTPTAPHHVCHRAPSLAQQKPTQLTAFNTFPKSLNLLQTYHCQWPGDALEAVAFKELRQLEMDATIRRKLVGICQAVHDQVGVLCVLGWGWG